MNEREKNYSFTGRLHTAVTPYHLGESDFSELVNFHYTDTGIKTVRGESVISEISSEDVAVVSSVFFDGTVCYQTYPVGPNWTVIKVVFGDQEKVIAKKYQSNSQYSAGDTVLVGPYLGFFLECVQSGTTGSTPPQWQSYTYNASITDGTVVWIKREGNLVGKFTVSPDNTVAYTNGYHNLICGGRKFRVGKVVNVDESNLGSELVSNGSFSSSSGWTWGTGWSWQSYEARHSANYTQPLSQTISTTSGLAYRVMFYLRKDSTSGSVTPSLGATYPATPATETGVYIYDIIASSSYIYFYPTSDFVGAVDDVSVRQHVGDRKIIDVTDDINNMRPAIIYKSTLGNIIIDIGTPLKIRGITVFVSQPNTQMNSVLRVFRYSKYRWQSSKTLVDGTNKLSQSGHISFSFEDDDDTIFYFHNVYLYWYRIMLSPTSGSLPSSISIQHIYTTPIIQSIPNIWDATPLSPLAFYVESGSDSWLDYTIGVLKKENAFIYTTTWVEMPGTVAKIGGYTTYYIGSPVPLTGFRVYFPVLSTNNTYYINTTDNTISVSYWNGRYWVPVSGLIDGTRHPTQPKSHSRNGTIIWIPAPEGQEKKRAIMTDTMLYYYKITANYAFSSQTLIDYIETIPSLMPPKNYITCAKWSNRLVLAGTYTGYDKNTVLISAPNSPYIWDGSQTLKLNIGSNTPILNLAVLFTRYGTDIQETLVVFKEDEIHLLTWIGSEIRTYQISTKGTSYPRTVQTCDLGLRITEGINRSVIIFANDSGVYFFDNATLISISDDILPLVQLTDYSFGFYDSRNSWYHLACEGYELVFDLIRKKWFKIDRGDNRLYWAMMKEHTPVGFSKGKMLQLNSGRSNRTSLAVTGIKPLEQSFFTITNLRRIRLCATEDEQATMKVTITTESDSVSTSEISLSRTIHEPIPVNVSGIAYQFKYEVNNADSVELINTGVVYYPKRIEL